MNSPSNFHAQRPGATPPLSNLPSSASASSTPGAGFQSVHADRQAALAAKRVLDFSVALIAILLLSPLLLFIAAAIKLSSPGPILYRGLRVGRRGVPFRMFKFRTMIANAEDLGGSATPEDDPRITSIGRFLRRYKLDELPQFLNLLAGQMSLVGPRADVQKYADMYSEDQKVVLDLYPGITDWATIWNSDEAAVLQGSSDPERTYEELIRPTKVALQMLYARHHSLGIDLKIIFHTICKLFWKHWTPRELAPYGKVRCYKLISQIPTQPASENSRHVLN